MNERLPTGTERLDEVLGGGLLKNAINLIVGVPGSGKTILSQQIAFRNATADRPALYLSTLSEPMEHILRFAERFDFFDHAAIPERRVMYEDIGPVLVDGGLHDVVGAIEGYLKRLRPGIVLIDTFAAFKAFAKDQSDFRRFLYGLVRRLTATATTSVWNAPYTRAQAFEAAEYAAADAIIALDMVHIAEREIRLLQVLKLRGSDFRSGQHLYRIASDGFRVYPRLADSLNDSVYELDQNRAATGIAALDALLGEAGYWRGSTTLIAGPSGIGKTLMGLHFIYHGAASGEPGILATFQENRSQLQRTVASFGWSSENPSVHVFSRSVVNMNIDEWVYELLDRVERTGAKRIVVDSLPDIMAATSDPIRFREWMFSLAQRCTRNGISLMMIVEVPDLFQLNRVSQEGISHLADNVVLLQYVQDGPELARALTILKTRAMRHRPMVHRFEITARGFELGDVLSVSR